MHRGITFSGITLQRHHAAQVLVVLLQLIFLNLLAPQCAATTITSISQQRIAITDLCTQANMTCDSSNELPRSCPSICNGRTRLHIGSHDARIFPKVNVDCAASGTSTRFGDCATCTRSDGFSRLIDIDFNFCSRLAANNLLARMDAAVIARLRALSVADCDDVTEDNSHAIMLANEVVRAWCSPVRNAGTEPENPAPADTDPSPSPTPPADSDGRPSACGPVQPLCNEGEDSDCRTCPGVRRRSNRQQCCTQFCGCWRPNRESLKNCRRSCVRMEPF